MPDLAKEIEIDLSWREAELASFKALVSLTEKGSVRESALLRALWALLYAHFEGFCKFAWDLYLDVLEKEKTKRSLLKDQIAWLSLEQVVKTLKSNFEMEQLWHFCLDELPKLLAEPAVFKTKLETRSNLWPDVFLENSEKVSLPTSMIDEHKSEIKTLVARRNDIAHGKKIHIKDLSEYKIYEDSAFFVMHELAIGVIESIEHKKYLK